MILRYGAGVSGGAPLAGPATIYDNNTLDIKYL